MEWEWFLPTPADLLAPSIRRWLKKRRTEALQRSARSWPKARGRIQAVMAKRADDPPDSWRCWQTGLSFSYVVNGEYYSGYSLLPPESEGQVAEEVKRWCDRDVTVRYWPEMVSESVLLVEDQSASS